MLTHRYRNIILASLLIGSSAFTPSSMKSRSALTSASPFISKNNHYGTSNSIINNQFSTRSTSTRSSSSTTTLQMSSDDWNEGKYTESAWACILSLTKAADYYSSTTVDSPMLLDIFLNPSKHNAGDDAESAKKVVEKVLLRSGVDVTVLRQETEIYMSKQPKISGNKDVQKTMGRTMTKVLDRARDNQALLGVSLLLVILFILLFCFIFADLEYDHVQIR
jgi:hypothetical protein